MFGPGGFFGSATHWPIHFIDEWLNGSQLATASALAADPETWGSIGGDLISLALAGEPTGPETLAWQAYVKDRPAIARLRADPGPGLTPYVERRIELTTPFPVEDVRSSPTHAGAPVLVPMPAGYGAPAPAEVLVLAPEVDRETAGALLQRRKLERASDDDMWFATDAEELAVRELPGFAGLPVVLYAAGAPNLPEVIPDDIPAAEKARCASARWQDYCRASPGVRQQGCVKWEVHSGLCPCGDTGRMLLHLIRSAPPIYGRSTSGTTIEPSAC